MSSVGIFWDFENCHPPSGMSGYTVVEKIKQAVRSLGSISIFKAYFDVNREATKGIQQHELQCSGVSLIHTPHASGKKDVADKVLLVDLMIFALQGNEKKTIVLIAGDQDYSYAISMLRSRGKDVFVISSSFSAHRGLGRLASETLLWKEDVLMAAEDQRRRVFGQESTQEAPFTQTQSQIYIHAQQYLNAIIRKVLKVATQFPGTISHVVLSIMKPLVNTCCVGTYSVLIRFIQTIWGRYLLSKKVEELEAHRVIEEVGAESESSAECSQAEQGDKEPNGFVKQTASSGMTARTSSNYTEATQIEATPDGFASESVEDNSPLGLHSPSPHGFSALIAVLREDNSAGWIGMECRRLKSSLEQADLRVYESAGVAGFRQYIEAARDANIVFFFAIDWETESGYIILRSWHVQRYDTGSVQVTEMWKRSKETAAVLPSVVTGSQQKTTPSSLAPRFSRKPVDSNFRPLVDELRQLRSSGVVNIERGKLSPKLLKRDSKLASRMGVNIKKYISRAEQLSYILITRGARGKMSLVALHPDYH